MLQNLSNTLQPYKETVGVVASVVTILQFFSGSLICRDIYRRGSTKGVSAVPFIGGVVIGVLLLKFALILQDKNMFNVNVAAIILNAIYLLFYIAYSENKRAEVFSPSFKGLLLVGVLLTYLNFEDPSNIEFRYGLIVTVIMLGVMAAPLMETKDIIRTKDASSIPFPLVFTGFIVSILWLLYGIILMNDFMIVQNTLGTMLCLVQLLLTFMYPGPHVSIKED